MCKCKDTRHCGVCGNRNSGDCEGHPWFSVGIPYSVKDTCKYDEDTDTCPGIGCNHGCTCQVVLQRKPFNQLEPKPDYPFNGMYTADEE